MFRNALTRLTIGVGRAKLLLSNVEQDSAGASISRSEKSTRSFVSKPNFLVSYTEGALRYFCEWQPNFDHTVVGDNSYVFMQRVFRNGDRFFVASQSA